MPLFFNKPGAQRYRMPWGAVAGAAVTYGLNSMSKKDNGGAGTQTATKEPWLPAQGWIQDNLASGKALQQRYTQNPQSAEQLAAVNNIYGQSDYMRGLVPSLLGQIGQQQVGFDPSNPTARPKAWSWDGLLGASPGAPDLHQQSVQTPAPLPTPAAVVPDKGGDFRNQQDLRADQIMGSDTSVFNGGFGSFKYGQTPAKGTKEYRDQQEYLAYGGSDPLGLYSALAPQPIYVPAGGA